MPNTPTRFPALAVVLSSLAALCLAEDHQPQQPEEPRMLTAQAERPAIDREAPARFETASFAVG